MKFGIDRLLADPELRKPLEGKRVALLAHPASVTAHLTHSLDALVATGLNVSAVFGPQHGVRGDLQDNMMESPDYTDPTYGMPVFSLYGEVRRPTGQSMGTFDVILIDLQDVGCRIYTFVTTLLYVLEAAAQHEKQVWVLDRPNPAGRPVEGLTLLPGWESFVGAGPMPMRHGMTLGEMGSWFIHHFGLDVDYTVIGMEGWQPETGPGFGWPPERPWINPSPNAANVNMARAYAGTEEDPHCHASPHALRRPDRLPPLDAGRPRARRKHGGVHRPRRGGDARDRLDRIVLRSRARHPQLSGLGLPPL